MIQNIRKINSGRIIIFEQQHQRSTQGIYCDEDQFWKNGHLKKINYEDQLKV